MTDFRTIRTGTHDGCAPRFHRLQRPGHRRWSLALAAMTCALACANSVAQNRLALARQPVLPHTHAYQGMRLLARVSGQYAWHTSSGSDLAAAQVAISDDDGVMAIVPPQGDYQPHTIHLYDPDGYWQIIATQQTSMIGGPTASQGRYFTWSWNGIDANNAGIYGVDTATGYAGTVVDRLGPLPQTANFLGVIATTPIRLGDGQVALSIRGFVDTILQTGTMWGLLDTVSGQFTPWLASNNIDPQSPWDTLCNDAAFTPVLAGGNLGGFFGCGHVSGDTAATWAIHSTIPGYGISIALTDAEHAGSIDAEGDYAWAYDNHTTPAVQIQRSTGAGRLVYGMNWGFNHVLDDSPIRLTTLSPGAQPHIVFQVRAHEPLSAPEDDDFALYAADFPQADEGEVVRRIVGRGDRVMLEDGRSAWLEADQGTVLYPDFDMNRHGDLVLVADLIVLDERGGTQPAGQGLIMVEHGIFGDGFD